MTRSSLLFGFLPLAVFVAVDFVADETTGILFALGFALLEGLYSLYRFRRIDGITITSFVFLGIFALISMATEDSTYFKLQPVALGFLFSLVFFGCQAIGKPLLPIIFSKYGHFIPGQAREKISHPVMQKLLRKLSLYLGYGFFLHAMAVAYSAYYLSNAWWLAVRGIGLYVVLAVCMLAARWTERRDFT